MPSSISTVSLVVKDYDEAIHFFTDCLRFILEEDTPMGSGKRWVIIAPSGGKGASLLLARAATEEQEAHIGDQTGDRVFLFLRTNDFWGDYKYMKEHGVRFTEEPRLEKYGQVVVFQDLYGNKWDLIQA